MSDYTAAAIKTKKIVPKKSLKVLKDSTSEHVNREIIQLKPQILISAANQPKRSCISKIYQNPKPRTTTLTEESRTVATPRTSIVKPKEWDDGAYSLNLTSAQLMTEKEREITGRINRI